VQWSFYTTQLNKCLIYKSLLKTGSKEQLALNNWLKRKR